MTYKPSDAQLRVIDSQAQTVIVLGGAGAGKTTTAAAAATRRLAALDAERAAIKRATPFGTTPVLPVTKRVLFLSFSRTAVSQIVDRSASVLAALFQRVDLMTFHGLAWRILNDFGRHHGHPYPLRVQSASETKLRLTDTGISYAQLIPAARQVLKIPGVTAYYRDRYAVVICDEFQDTSDVEWEFMQSIAPGAQRILLGDVNQCIYASMKKIDPAVRVADALALPGAEQVTLPPLSFRDPSGVLPAAADAALKRRFDHPALEHAVLDGRLVLHPAGSAHVIPKALAVISDERRSGNTVSVFTHTHAATSELSTAMAHAALSHEQVGFSEALGDALQAQFMLMRWALTHEPGGRDALAVYLLSISRGRNATAAASAIRSKSNPTFEDAIKSVTADLLANTTSPLNLNGMNGVLRSAHQRLGFPRDEETWRLANQYLQRAARGIAAGGRLEDVAMEVQRIRGETLVGLLRGSNRRIQVMNLHQTKGREADATVLLLQEDEYHGDEVEPFPMGSRLLYVCMTRARMTAHIIVPSRVHALWEPLVTSCIGIRESGAVAGHVERHGGDDNGK